ncbi:hypothetical protein CcI49_11725 [Frankia sp. CcI49]|nr:hypothetical protein CcI49_11725 [Frankia sp. CcI49]
MPVTPPTENTPGARTSVTRKIITVILSLAAAALTLTVTWPNTGGGQDPSEDNGLGSDAPLTAPWSSTFLASLNQRLDLDRAPAEDDAPESGDGDQVWDALVQPDELYVNTGKNVIIASSSDREECAAAATSDPSVPFTQGQVVCVRTDQRHVVILEFVADRGSQIQIRGRLVP